MDTIEPCSICGCTETNLINGFYYCVECGTQDTNVRETFIDYTTLGDGTFAITSRKRIRQIPKTTEAKMTDDWYKWHCLNFLLKGLADELIELGAAPSFKTKLLWIWTRYMKKYQNKADFGLATNEELDDNEQDEVNPTVDEKAYSSDEEEDKRERINRLKIEVISMPLIISFLCVALNLDKSQIQLTHLIRFIRERRISIVQWRKLVPQEMRPTILRNGLFYNHKCFEYSITNVRILALDLFRKLDLGNPVVPELRPLVEEYIQELCLPNDLKPLVLSLMHYRSFDYLDVNVKFNDFHMLPSYEIYVMSHILLALKICFGLDCEYEVRLSDAVDKINDIENHPKSYNSQPTERLFNFRDWCNYIQFRKTLLRTHTLYVGEPHYFDMNDYVAFEHQNEKLDFKKTIIDEIAAEIINKIPSPEINVIPKSEFVATLTPHTTYTRVILEHQQDPNVKQMLSEDFTQYSLEYIIKDMFLVNPDSTNPSNIIAGVSGRNMQQTKTLFNFVDTYVSFAKGMVYVKDCDNHNWMVTRRPQLEHVSTAEQMNKSGENKNDHEYVSNPETLQNVMKTNNMNLDDTQKTIEEIENSVMAIDSNNKVNDVSSIKYIEMETDKEERSDDAIIVSSTNIDSGTEDIENSDEDIKLLQIREEDSGKNIFDDDFEDFETKQEKDKDPKEKEPGNNDDVFGDVNRSLELTDTFVYSSTQNYQPDNEESDNSSIDSIHLTPESFNREEAINQLIIHAAHKYKTYLPGKYKYIRKKKDTPRGRPLSYKTKIYREKKQKVNDVISDYHTHLQEDIFYQISNMVKTAINDFNQTKESETPMESADLQIDDEIDAANNRTIENEPNNANEEQNADQDENVTSDVDDNQYNLFGDDSDGETHAEDLLPKKNPEFDEETHDIKQLYIKPAENPSVPQMALNPNLLKIIDQKIEADKNGEESQTQVNTEVENSDSEEDLPISVLQELKRIREQLTKQEMLSKANRLKPLIQTDIPSYKMWVRHYNKELINLGQTSQRFANEIEAKMPKSFLLVLQECSDVIGYPPYNVYIGLQRAEDVINHKHVKNKEFRRRREKQKKYRFDSEI